MRKWSEMLYKFPNHFQCVSNFIFNAFAVLLVWYLLGAVTVAVYAVHLLPHLGDFFIESYCSFKNDERHDREEKRVEET